MTRCVEMKKSKKYSCKILSNIKFVLKYIDDNEKMMLSVMFI